MITWLRRRVRPATAVAVAVAAAAAGVVALVSSDGVAAGRYDMGDGAAWLPSTTTGELVLVDGTTGRVSARVGRVGPGELSVAQAGADALVVNRDRDTGTVFRIDGESQALAVLAGGNQGIKYTGASRVLVGDHVAYVVRPGAQQVNAVDVRSLAPLSDTAQAFTGRDFDAAVDAEDTLWLLDRDAGRVQAVTRTELRAFADLGAAGHDADIVLAGTVPVVVDRTDAEVVELDPGSGRSRGARNCPWFARGDKVQVAGTTSHRPWVSIAVPSAGSLLVADLSKERCPAPIPLTQPGDNDFGRPVEADGLVYIPVISSGRIVVVDPTVPKVVADPPVVDPGTPFELVVEDGLVFYNAPSSHQAGTIAADGSVQAVDKFDPKAKSGSGDEPATTGLRCSVTETEVAPNNDVGFTASADGGPPADVVWDFGDTRSSTDNPTRHAYARPGTYRASARTEGDTAGCPPISVDPAHAGQDDLTAKIRGPRQVVVGQPSTYSDASEGTVATRSWELPGGEPSTSTDARVAVTFRKPGAVKIRLTVKAPDGSSDTVMVAVEVVQKPAVTTTTSRPTPGETAPPATNPPPTEPPTTPPPTPPIEKPGPGPCTAPAGSLTATAASVTVGQSATFTYTSTAGESRCTVDSISWAVDGPARVTKPDGESFTHTFTAVGNYVVEPTIAYTTAGGSPATAKASPTGLPVAVTEAEPSCDGRIATIVGTPGNDVLVGTEGDDVIDAGPGDDQVKGLGGNDVICGGDGNDRLGQGLDGGPGDDVVFGGPGNDAVTGNSGNDVLYGDDGDDYVDGGVGGCCDLVANTGDDDLFGGVGNDTLHAADKGRADMYGEGGNDKISGYDGSDSLVGGIGKDDLSGGNEDDVIDLRDATAANDTGDAGPGNDKCLEDGNEPVLDCDAAQNVTAAVLTAETNPAVAVRPCPATIRFSGSVTVSGGTGPVSYRFTRSDGFTSAAQVLQFNGGGTQAVETTWTLGAGGGSYSGWVAITILGPNPPPEVRAEFSFTCATLST